MSNAEPELTALAEGVVPEILPAPEIAPRAFEPQPWYRPRKQFVRKYQWNHEIITQIVNNRAAPADATLRVLGIPSSEYLDLLSMQEFCEARSLKIVYLGFNHSIGPSVDSLGSSGASPISIYQQLQAQRMVEASSFVHTSSLLVPDRFEQIRIEHSMARNVLDRFADFDVVNLDLCGCVVHPDGNRATDALSAIVALLRWQSTRRLAPWLFFITTFASPWEINRPACIPLVQAVKENADNCREFDRNLTEAAQLNVSGILECFQANASVLPESDVFVRIFALAFGKWLAARLRAPIPPALVAMLPSYCFRQQHQATAHLLSLAYLILPSPSPGEPGFLSKPGPAIDLDQKYRTGALKMLARSFGIKDLDAMLTSDANKLAEMVNETEQLLVNCGFDAEAVRHFLAAQH